MKVGSVKQYEQNPSRATMKTSPEPIGRILKLKRRLYRQSQRKSQPPCMCAKTHYAVCLRGKQELVRRRTCYHKGPHHR
ncbi:hypothetical protein DPMN_073284 [Dreissena polymorpha]|uniref:Uncharacterized protein n=1 Tax=Dreissena polymorpha TaxID=45954 RepID=A0A9D4BYR7_DREPO|nr:hypothetical protein DPMN_073284 [Dreissena polymorpha]